MAEQLAHQAEQVEALPVGPESLATFVAGYLSPAHRDDRAGGCPSAALLDEVGRGDRATRDAYTQGARRLVDAVARHLAADDRMTSDEAHSRAIGVLALLVGALQSARAVTDRELSDHVLATAYTHAMSHRHLPRPAPPRTDRSGTPMKAFVVTTYGPDGLRAEDVARPTLGPRDVLVEVRAASINPLDKMVRNGEFKQLIGYRLPFVLGHDLAGVVTEVGAGVRSFAVGDEVYARPRDLRIGAFAEEIAIDAADVALKPTSLSFEEAAAVPLVALAAWQALVDLADIKPGQKVLVHAGAGGLGSTVIQVAKHLGAHVATTAHTDDLDTVRALGADEAIDYTEPGLHRRPVRLRRRARLPRGREPGEVADRPQARWVGDQRGRAARRGVRPTARQAPAPAGHGGAEPQGPPRAKKLGVRYSFFFMRADGAQLASLAALYDDGTLRPVLDRTFGFDETLEAMAYVEQGKAHGKIVVTR